MRFVGRIDIERFRRFFPDLTTAEVIITDERIEHIEKRHPGAYKKYGQFIPEVLDSYNFLMKDAMPNTVLLLKRLKNADGTRIQLVLRLHTTQDAPGFKNSVISMWKIDSDRWKYYKRSKKILDKRE